MVNFIVTFMDLYIKHLSTVFTLTTHLSSSTPADYSPPNTFLPHTCMCECVCVCAPTHVRAHP